MRKKMAEFFWGTLYTFLLVLTDCADFLAAFAVAYLVRSRLLIGITWFAAEPMKLGEQLRAGGAVAFFLLIIILAFERVYSRRRVFWEETRALVRGTTLTFILIMTLVFLTRSAAVFSRATIVLAWAFSLFFLPLGRLAVKKALRLTGLGRKNVIIVGANNIAQLLAKEIRKNDYLGYDIAGFLDAQAAGDISIADEAHIIGRLADLQDVVKAYQVRDLFIALPNLSERELFRTIKLCETAAERIRIVSKIGSLYIMGLEVEALGDVTALSVACRMAKPWTVFVKHNLELLAAVVLTALIAPFGLLIALAIRLDSRGPIIYSQDRLGKGGSVFRFLKFRTMYQDADRQLEAYLAANPEARQTWDRYRKIKGHDPRVTRVGRFLRRLSLDELPQLLNVLRGDMDLIGPRPYMVNEKELMGDAAAIISRVRPGITGLWQVRGRNLLSFDYRLVLDEYYIRNWSLWLDLVILAKTVKALARREGAF